jgi:hypothetical protein
MAAAPGAASVLRYATSLRRHCQAISKSEPYMRFKESNHSLTVCTLFCLESGVFALRKPLIPK